MNREKANKFIGKKVRVIFKFEWFNEAVQSWVLEDEEHIGILKHCENESQKHLYYLDTGDKATPVHNSCWSANRMKSITEVL